MRCNCRFGTCVMAAFVVVFSLRLITFAQEMHSPTPRAAPQMQEKARHDNPKEQADWFVNDRRYPPMSHRLRIAAAPGSAAEKLREAFAENERAKSKRTASEGASWTELGPRPQLSTAWGNVSGRH